MQAVEPGLGAKVPGRHERHDCEPAEGLYVPAAQIVQAAAPGEGAYLPAAQLAQAEAPVVANAPTGQAMGLTVERGQ